MTMTPTQIIDEIERLRVSAGLSQAEFAKRIGLSSQQLWSHYVTGKATHLPIDLIIRALEMFDRHLELYDGERQAEVTVDHSDTSKNS